MTTQNVSAAQMSSDQLMKDYYDSYGEVGGGTDNKLLKLIKKTPYLTAYPGQTVRSLSKQRVTDVTSNYGHISSTLSMNIYQANDNGRPDFSQLMSKSKTLKSNGNYVAALRYEVKVHDEEPGYAYASLDKDSVDDIMMAHTDQDDAEVALLVPIYVNGTKPASTKVNVKGYVNTRKRNSRVRTYTSTGKFSKYYVYGHHTYRLNQKKNINGQGLCHKIYGKNQWISASKLTLR